jgi:hypothetical protein
MGIWELSTCAGSASIRSVGDRVDGDGEGSVEGVDVVFVVEGGAVAVEVVLGGATEVVSVAVGLRVVGEVDL